MALRSLSPGASPVREAQPFDRRLPAWFELVLALVVLLLSVRFTILHLEGSLVHPPASLAKLCAGVAELPYQYRALTPWIIAAIARTVGPLPWVDALVPVAGVVEATSVFLLFYATRALLAPCSGSRTAATVAAFGVFYLLPFQYLFPRHWPFWYPSDLPSVLFFTLGLLLLHRRRWSLYYPMFVLATFNRETTVFLPLVLVLTNLGRARLGSLVAHAGAQAAIWLGVRWILHERYGANPGLGGSLRSPGRRTR